MIDTHCHLNLDPLVKDYLSYFEQAKEIGVSQVIIPGVNVESSQKAVELARDLEGLFPAIGLHPEEAEQALTTQKSQEIYNWLVEWGSKSEVVAIGECGLDYFRLPDDPLQAKHIKAFQKKLFKLHIKAALEVDKPLLIHVRDVDESFDSHGAHYQVMELLEKHQPKAVLHCFSGDQTYLKKALDLGLYISFAGNLTFKNAPHLGEIVTKVPKERLLLETDAPYLNPDRGQWPNTPAQVAKTYEYASQLLNISQEDLSTQVHQNSQSFFGI